jgi:hypothetical protein
MGAGKEHRAWVQLGATAREGYLCLAVAIRSIKPKGWVDLESYCKLSSIALCLTC